MIDEKKDIYAKNVMNQSSTFQLLSKIKNNCFDSGNIT